MNNDEDNYDIEVMMKIMSINLMVIIINITVKNNCIEAYNGNTSNPITIDIDYAFLCCDLFIKCFKTSSLCIITKNGFYFHYHYDNRLRSSKVFKYDYGFDIKNNTVVRMPPSYYNDTSKGELRSDQFKYLYFRFNNPTILPENIITFVIKFQIIDIYQLKIYMT